MKSRWIAIQRLRSMVSGDSRWRLVVFSMLLKFQSSVEVQIIVSTWTFLHYCRSGLTILLLNTLYKGPYLSCLMASKTQRNKPGLTSQRHSALISCGSEYFQVCFSAVHYLKISEQRWFSSEQHWKRKFSELKISAETALFQRWFLWNSADSELNSADFLWTSAEQRSFLNNSEWQFSVNSSLFSKFF